MTQISAFTLHADSNVLTPDVPGMRVLVDCLRDGQAIKAQQSVQTPIAPVPAAQQWVMCETSGSSGHPKVIRRSPQSWMQSFGITAERFAIGAADIYATFGSLGHSLTLYASVEALSLGADICALVHLGPKRQAMAVNTMGVTVIYATPTQLGLLIKGAAQGQIASFPLVRYVFCGGGKLSEAVKAATQTLCPNAALFEFFGASETSFITLSDRQTPLGSVGRCYPGVTVRIDAPAGAPGEIWVKSPYVFDGYEGGDHKDTQWDAAYLSIGEMGFQDAGGNLYLCGRKNRMVTIADVNVFPEEVERAIAQLDGVQDCAVIGVPDPKRGHRLVCFVRSGSNTPDAAGIRGHCRAALGPHAVPQDIQFIAQIPMLAAGKPDLQRLAAMIEDR